MIRLFSAIISLLILSLSTNYSHASSKMAYDNEYVVILHGIARSKSHMQDLADYLSNNNYDVINIDYPSTGHDLKKLSKIIQQEISLKTTDNKKGS